MDWITLSSLYFQEVPNRIKEERKRQNSYHNIFDSDEEEFHKDFFSDFVRPKSVGTIPKSKRNLSTNISDPCLLSCLPPEGSVSGQPSSERSTNNSQLNSLDSGIPDEISLRRFSPCSDKESQEREAHFQRVFVERQSDSKSDNHFHGNSLGHEPKTTNLELDIQNLNSKLDKTTEELNSLKISHGKLQKVLSEKASELSHAVRKAEVYEREAKKLRYKLEELRRQQRQERQDRSSTSSEKEVRGNHRRNVAERRKNNLDSSIFNNTSKQNAENSNVLKEVSSSPKEFEDEIYDEIDNCSEKTDDNDIYDTPNPVKMNNVKKIDPELLSKGCDEDSVNKCNVFDVKQSVHNDQLEMRAEGTEDNQIRSDESNLDNANIDSNQAIYATVNLEMKKNFKRPKDCNNGNLILTEKENIVALI